MLNRRMRQSQPDNMASSRTRLAIEPNRFSQNKVGGMLMELEGKVALVTGAGGGGPGGMGKGIALGLAREGADVAVNDISSELAEATAEEIKSLGRRAVAVPADVTKDTEVDRLVDRAVKELG